MGRRTGVVGGVDAGVGGRSGRVVVRRAAGGGGPRAAGGAGRAGWAVGRSVAAGTGRAGLGADRPRARPTDDPDGQLCAADGIKQRTGWGYETLVREVSDSLHLRRFGLLPLTQRVPDESTVRKLVGRLGPETVNQLTLVVIGKAQREARFVARAVRIDATVVEADIRYPTDAGLAGPGARALARAGGKLAGRMRGPTRRVVDRSRRLGKRVRAISWTLARRTGQRREEVMKLNAQAGRILARSIGAAGMLAAQARASARGRAPRPSWVPRSGWRSWPAVAGGSPPDPAAIPCEKIADRLVSVSDPPPARSARASWQAQPVRRCRPAGRGHRHHPTRHPRLGAAGGQRTRQPGREPPAAQTAAELDRLGLRPREVALDGGLVPGPTTQTLAGLAPPGCSSRDGPSRAPGIPAGAWPATAPAARAGSATSSVAMAAAQPPARRPGPADLDRLGGPGLQPRHPRHPDRLVLSTTRLRPPTTTAHSDPTVHTRPPIRGK